MKLTTKKTVLIIITCIGLALAPSANAVHHATNFLAALESEVTNRVANTNLGYTAAQKRALASAKKSLGRTTKTLATDLIALSSAINALDKEFPADSTLAGLEDNALAAYSAEAHAQLDNADLHLGTNAISKGLSNQFAKILIALADADAKTNNVAQAKALANVFNRMRQPVAKILQQYPTIPFEAPAGLVIGQNITLSENAVVNEQTKFFFHVTDNMGSPYFNYTSDNPEELGIYTYQRLTATTAVLHCNVTFTQAGATPPPYNHDMSLTFTSATGGTFTGVNCLNENITGTFTLE